MGANLRAGMPCVRFSGFQTQTVITFEDHDIEVEGKVVATRAMIPLCLAWALTIHRCQGLTLDEIYADLGNCFEVGQAYVAASRVRTGIGLKLLRFNTASVKSNGRAREFLSSCT
jgi:ATP-dependent DNA helicase PIF1